MAKRSNLDERTIVVTGGGSGIGAAAARRAFEAGASIAILDANEEHGRAVASEFGSRGAFARCDVTDERSIERGFSEAVMHLPPVRGLVCCAGAPSVPLPIEETSLASWDRTIQSHLTGTFLSCKVIGGAVARQGQGGAIVTTASVVGFNAGPVIGYGAAKAAIVNLTKALAVQWASRHVRVNAIAPGWTDTPFLRPNERGGERDFTAILAACPQGRLLAPEEIAEVIWFLLSTASSAVTGATIVCDGGTLAGAGWAPYGGFPAAADAVR